MTAFLTLMAGLLCCAQAEATADQGPETAPPKAQDAEVPSAPIHPAPSKIVAVTIFRNQALVTREVAVAEGNGTLELVVTPLPAQTVDGTLRAEGSESVRILSTRFRTRAVANDTRKEVSAKRDQIKQITAEIEKLQDDVTVHEQDLLYVTKLEEFTTGGLRTISARGKLDSAPILTLSKFIMEERAQRSAAKSELKARFQAATEAVTLAKRQLAELSSGTVHHERDAVVTIQKTRREAAVLRLAYLVDAASWEPQYRLRSALANGPVRLEYLAAVTQQTGEDWPPSQITLCTARPSLDASPPDLLPLKMAVADPLDPVEATDDRSQHVRAALDKPVAMQFPNGTPLEDVLKYIRSTTQSAALPEGIPVYVDPIGLREAEITPTAPVSINLTNIPLRVSLKLLLDQVRLKYTVSDGLLKIIYRDGDDEESEPQQLAQARAFLEQSGQSSLDETHRVGGAVLNYTAARDQASELHVNASPSPADDTAEREVPSVTFAIAGRLGLPSRPDPQLLEVARVELPAQSYAKAVPVLSPRVYRLAKLTNQTELVLLPGEASVYVADDFVGRMRLPLVAAGEAFIAGFGVDPQLQVSRRLLHKSRTVQGGNQIFVYEFRISLRNYRSVPTKVQLWDRLPTARGETIGVNLTRTSAELSTDPLYLRTGRLDNLLRWDLDVPAGTVGDKPLDLTYEFRLEYARDLPQPVFVSGSLKELPIGGGAMGGGMGGMGLTGGMGGGFRSIPSRAHEAVAPK